MKAGMCILREAGGRVFGGRQSTLEGRVENDASLFGRSGAVGIRENRKFVPVD